MRTRFTTCSALALLQVASCGGTEEDSHTIANGPTPMTGEPPSENGSSSAGAASSSAGVAIGGTGAGGTNASAPRTEGSSASNGAGAAVGASGYGGSIGGALGESGAATAGSGSGDTGDAPFGVPDSCLGDGCPFGECGTPFTDDCDEVYAGGLDAHSAYCASNSNDGYCLAVLSDHVDDWAISCSNGNPTFDLCDAGCNVSGGVANCN